MVARAAVYSLLQDDGTLSSLGVDAVYPTNSIDTPPEYCFLVIRWEVQSVTFGDQAGRIGPARATIWAHDRDKDYGRISDVLDCIENLLTATVHRAGEDGWTLTQADCTGQGPDLYDDGYDTCTRYSEFNIVSRRTT